jgi:GTP cyclohydrolase II
LKIAVSNQAKLPSRFGEFVIQSFKQGDKEHLVIMTPHFLEKKCDAPLVRVHSECLTGDALGSLKCDCGEQLQRAFEMIQEQGCGMVIYLRQEGRGIGLFNKINAYALQDQGLDTVEANHQLGFANDERNFEIVSTILEHYGVKSIRLLTNNPKKLEEIKGVEIKERVSIIVASNPHNEGYLKVKKEKSGHLL